MIVSSSAYRLIREVKVTRKTLLGLLRPSGKKVRARERGDEITGFDGQLVSLLCPEDDISLSNCQLPQQSNLRATV